MRYLLHIGTGILITTGLLLVVLTTGGHGKERLVLATGNWEPYYGEKLRNGGIVAEIVRKSFHRAGYDVEIRWLPWSRAISMARDGKYDGVMGAWHTEERAVFFTYSKPFFRNEIVFFKHRNSPITYGSLDDLSPYRIGVTLNSGAHELLKAKLAKNLDTVPNPVHNVGKLIKKRFDLLADEKLGTIHIINNSFPHWRYDFKILEPPLQVNQLHVMISKQNANHRSIVGDFNEGLRQILQDGTFSGLMKKHEFN